MFVPNYVDVQLAIEVPSANFTNVGVSVGTVADVSAPTNVHVRRATQEKFVKFRPVMATVLTEADVCLPADAQL